MDRKPDFFAEGLWPSSDPVDLKGEGANTSKSSSLFEILNELIPKVQKHSLLSKEYYVLLKLNQRQSLIKVDTNAHPFHFSLFNLEGRAALKGEKEVIEKFGKFSDLYKAAEMLTATTTGDFSQVDNPLWLEDRLQHAFQVLEPQKKQKQAKDHWTLFHKRDVQKPEIEQKTINNNQTFGKK